MTTDRRRRTNIQMTQRATDALQHSCSASIKFMTVSDHLKDLV